MGLLSITVPVVGAVSGLSLLPGMGCRVTLSGSCVTGRALTTDACLVLDSRNIFDAEVCRSSTLPSRLRVACSVVPAGMLCLLSA